MFLGKNHWNKRFSNFKKMEMKNNQAMKALDVISINKQDTSKYIIHFFKI